jgi:hypothetical protein
MTWFRREPEVQWMERFGDETETAREVADLVQEAQAMAR